MANQAGFGESSKGCQYGEFGGWVEGEVKKPPQPRIELGSPA